MKRILHFGGVLLALGMLLASCNIGVGDGQVAGDSVRNTSNVEGIVLKIDGIDNSSRTILPADWTDDTAEKLTYVLLAKEHGETGYDTIKTFDYSELKNGTATVNLKLVTWDLKLIGYISLTPATENTPSTPDKTKACLAAEMEEVDFSTGKKSVTFNLKPVQENEDGSKSDATGSINVDIEWSTNQPKRLEFGIYASTTLAKTIVDDEGRLAVIDSVETPSKKLNKILKGDELSQATGKNTANWSVDDKVKNGMYQFAAVFYDAETGGNVIGYYIDILYVDGGNLSKATVPYGDKFQKKPENPTWLSVETVFIPQNGDSTIEANSWYYAKFHWNDVSTNETGFELVITEEGKEDDPYIVNPTKLATSPLKSDKLLDDKTPATTANNHLNAGSTSIVLKLDTQKKYTAKIRAINDLTPAYYVDEDTKTPNTEAEFCEILNRNGDGQGRTYAPIVPESEDDDAVSYFGMFTVNYTIGDDETKSTVTEKDGKIINDDSVTNYVVGYNYSSQQQNLMGDSDMKNPHITNKDYYLDHWQKTTANSEGKKEQMYVIPALNIDNLELEPVWKGTKVDVHVTFPSYADAQDVKIARDRNDDNTVEFKYIKDDDDNDHIVVTAGESLVSPEFVLTDPKGNAVTDGTSKSQHTWTWKPTTAPKAGFYCLQITGQYEDAGSGRTLTLCGNVYIEVKN